MSTDRGGSHVTFYAHVLCLHVPSSTYPGSRERSAHLLLARRINGARCRELQHSTRRRALPCLTGVRRPVRSKYFQHVRDQPTPKPTRHSPASMRSNIRKKPTCARRRCAYVARSHACTKSCPGLDINTAVERCREKYTNAVRSNTHPHEENTQLA